MLYLIHGNDWRKARDKAREILASLSKKRPAAVLVRLEAEGLSEAKLEELSGSQGLFEKKLIIFSDKVCADPAAAEAVRGQLPAIADSENVFVFLETDLKADRLKSFEKLAEKVQKFSLPAKKGKDRPEFNIFSLSEALGRKDKKTLWKLYRLAIDESFPPEEISGVLFWQIKSMIVAGEAKTAAQSGLSPFVFAKARNFLKNYSIAELKKNSSRLVSIYHDSRRGISDFEVGLERFILEL